MAYEPGWHRRRSIWGVYHHHLHPEPRMSLRRGGGWRGAVERRRADGRGGMGGMGEPVSDLGHVRGDAEPRTRHHRDPCSGSNPPCRATLKGCPTGIWGDDGSDNRWGYAGRGGYRRCVQIDHHRRVHSGSNNSVGRRSRAARGNGMIPNTSSAANRNGTVSGGISRKTQPAGLGIGKTPGGNDPSEICGTKPQAKGAQRCKGSRI
jgi:hypothetical protein